MAKESNRFTELVKAIEAERSQEESYYRSIANKTSIQQRIDSGMLWWPVQINSCRYTVSEYIEVEVERSKVLNKSHKMKSGNGVRIFKEGRESDYKGVISRVRRNKISILLKDDAIIHDNDLRYGNVGLELTYDERPYIIMREAINDISTSNVPMIANLRRSYLKNETFSDINEFHVPIESLSDRLNDSQRRAINGVSNAADIAIIHGPPGTGKTTTLVELIVQLCKKEKKILVCAPSNSAVDLLAEMLDARNIPVLRVGNISRIGDELLHLALDEKMRSHSDWKHIKKVRIEADEARKQAGQYKRSFGESQRRDRSAMYKESKELKKWARELEDRLTDLILHEAKVICTTLIGASHKSIRHLKYSTCIIDEASQAMEPACWNAMLRSQRTILSGDHKQLSPVVKSDKAKELGLGITLLDRFTSNIHYDYLLDIQYRMNEKILEFSNKRHYQGKLLSHQSVRNVTLRNDSNAVTFIDTSGCGFYEEYNEKKRSYKNSQEYYLLREYILIQKEKQLASSIGLISPYATQVQFIQQEITEDNDLAGLDIEVNTIDGFQGQEKDIIYISLVRSNDQGNIGFLSDERRLNVAMTRAKKKMVLIGNLSTLSQHKLFRDLADFIEDNEFYTSAWEYMSY